MVTNNERELSKRDTIKLQLIHSRKESELVFKRCYKLFDKVLYSFKSKQIPTLKNHYNPIYDFDEYDSEDEFPKELVEKIQSRKISLLDRFEFYFGGIHKSIEMYVQNALEISKMLPLASTGVQYALIRKMMFEDLIAMHKDSLKKNRMSLVYAELGFAYGNLVNQSKENWIKSLSYFEKAIEGIDKNEDPYHWCKIKRAIGLTYQKLPQGDRATNMERSIEHLTDASSVSFKSDITINPNMIVNELAISYLYRCNGDKIENQETSKGFFEEALRNTEKYDEKSSDKAMRFMNLGVLYSNRLFGNKFSNLLCAISCYKKAIEILSDGDLRENLADCFLNIGCTYRSLGSDFREEYSEEAILNLVKALKIYSRRKALNKRAIALMNLGVAYQNLKKGDIDQNLEKSIYYYKKALKFRESQGSVYEVANVKVNLASAYANRIKGNQQVNLHQAKTYYQEVLKVYIKELYPNQHMEISIALAMAHMLLKEWNSAARILTSLPKLESQILQSETAQSSFFNRINQISKAYSMAAYCFAQNGKSEKAVEWLELGKSRIIKRAVERDKIRTCFEQGNQSAKKYEKLINELKYLESKQRISCLKGTNSISDILSRARTILAEINDIEKQLTDREGDDSFKFRDVERFIRNNRKAAIILLNITTCGSFIIIIANKEKSIVKKSFLIEDFNDDELIKITSLWTAALDKYRIGINQKNQQSRVTKEFEINLSDIMYNLNNALTNSIWNYLSNLDVEQLIIVPHKTLHILPLHLMCISKENETEYLIDKYEVSFLPAMSFLKRSWSDENTFALDSFLGIYNPTSDPNLLYSEPEVRNIGNYFKKKRILKPKDATVARIFKESGNYSVVHFACHAEHDMNDPFFSRMLMTSDKLPESIEYQNLKQDTLSRIDSSALPFSKQEEFINPETKLVITRGSDSGDENILIINEDGSIYRKHQLAYEITYSEAMTVDRILRDLSIRRTQMVVLSSCESGILDINLFPDEFIGLPAGFIASGVRIVVCSLWKIFDQATCRFMLLFYQNLLKHRDSPTKALRKAQLKFREKKENSSPLHWGAFQVYGV